MARLLLLLIVAVLIWYALDGLRGATGHERRRRLWRIGAWTVAGVLLLLVATGRVSWIVAPIAAIIPALRRAGPMLARAAPLLQRWWRSHDSARRHGDHASAGADQSAPMTRTRALAVLGLDTNAGRDEIRERHRQLMQKLHPDRGGSDYLAAELNRARAVLLGSR